MSYSRPPPNVGDLISLKVDNLTDRISCRTLRRIFEKYGPIGDVYIPRDRFTQESRGFAFIRFHDKHHAEEAMDAMDGIMLDGPPGADHHLRPDLASAAQSLHLAPVIVLHHPRDQVLLEGPSPPRSPDLPQQPHLGLDPEAFHQEESTGPEDNQKIPPGFQKRKEPCHVRIISN
uniref:RRM domain-containing protein n=1 Tax=Moschus moschiferus TaxID=68415 RepID=A0A8C6DSQ5_MOSMO